MFSPGIKWMAFALAVCGASTVGSTPAHAYNILKTNTGKAVHWDRANVVVLPGSNASARISPASVKLSILEAIRAWNGLPEMKVRFLTQDTATPEVKVEFCKEKWKFKDGLLATTEFQASTLTGIITSATIFVNECDHKFVGPAEVEGGALDLQATLVHELGHVLGLAHSEDPRSVMIDNTGAVSQRRPVLDDRQGLAAIYDPDFKPRDNPIPVATDIAVPPPTKASTTGKNRAPKSEEMSWDDVEVVRAAPKGKKAIATATAAATAPAPTTKPAAKPKATKK